MNLTVLLKNTFQQREQVQRCSQDIKTGLWYINKLTYRFHKQILLNLSLHISILSFFVFIENQVLNLVFVSQISQELWSSVCYIMQSYNYIYSR